MNPLQPDVATRLLRSLDAVTLTGRDVAIGGGVLVAILSIAKPVTWIWVMFAVVGTAAAIASSVRLRDRGRHGSLEREGRDGRSAGEVRSSADTLASAISGLSDAAIVLDGRLTILDANEPARQIFAIALGRHIAQTTRVPELLQAVDAALARAEVKSLQFQVPPPLDRTFAVRVTPLGHRGASYGPAILVLLRDMTEQEQLSRMRADFVANASHELRTPLASLKGFIETLQGAAKDDRHARERFLGIMQEQASRMSRLIDDLLSLSRIEMREHVVPTGIVDLWLVIEEVTAVLRPMATDAGIDLRTSNQAHPARVVGDSDELAQVVQNLTQNAIKYGRRGGKVEVVLAREGPDVSLSVRDDGIGIEPHHMPRLTERFYRVSAKDSRERGGTGLGLAIVKHILTRHRAQLHIASTPGQGSTFTVILPA